MKTSGANIILRLSLATFGCSTTGNTRKITAFKGEDRTPVWAADGESFYYLSEQAGSFNIYHRNIATGKDVQLTHEKKNPIRFLTSSADGLLCYGYDGEIYTVKEGAQPQKVNISITTDNDEPSLVRQVRSCSHRDSPLADAKEVTFVMHGDVYVTSTEYKTTKRITDTPQQERNVSFSPTAEVSSMPLSATAYGRYIRLRSRTKRRRTSPTARMWRRSSSPRPI